MALTFDTKARIPATALSTTSSAATADYTCGVNAEVLVVMILYAGVTARTGGAPTYNGVALTQAESRQGVTEASCELWYMLAPPTGSAYSINVPNDGGRTMWVYVASGNAASGYTCALDDTGANATTNSNPFVTVVTTTTGCLIFAVVASGDNTFAPSARTGTSLYEEDIAAYGGAGQYYVMAGSGSQNMSWTEATSDDYGAIGAAFKEVLAAISLTIQNASHAHTADSPSLTQHNVLVIQNGSHAHTADAIELIQHNILAIQNASNGHGADNVTLTAHEASIQLEIQNASHGHTADGISLTQHNALTIQNVSHAHTADGPALTQHNILAVQNGSHAHMADSPALTQHNILAIHNGSHAHTADEPALTQHNIISVADASHGHGSDNITLTAHLPGGIVLIIADASHSHEAENPTLTAHVPTFQLTIADASHGHGSESLALVQHNILEIQDADHLNGADNVIIIAHEPGGIPIPIELLEGMFIGLCKGHERKIIKP